MGKPLTNYIVDPSIGDYASFRKCIGGSFDEATTQAKSVRRIVIKGSLRLLYVAGPYDDGVVLVSSRQVVMCAMQELLDGLGD